MKAENVMKEEVVSVLSPLINIKAAFVENGIKTKVLVTCQVTRVSNGMCFPENKFMFLKLQRDKVFYPKRSI